MSFDLLGSSTGATLGERLRASGAALKDLLKSRAADRCQFEPWTRQATRSLCPECLCVVPAELVNTDGQIFMHKSCRRHGPFRELISTDADFFMRLESLASTYSPLAGRGDGQNANRVGTCPADCGICPQHLSQAVMINIDLTNRCNLRCPICFANADARGYVFEVTRDQVSEMMRRSIPTDGPVPSCVQFSGGEPTLHPEFVGILADARAAGFAQVQVATNGIRFARETDFARACAQAGLHIAYLQFDGVSDEVYRATRGRSLYATKLEAIENMYRAGIRTCLVPTIVKGLNDDQIGPILKFAVENTDRIAAVSWQPVSFTGRIDEADRLQQRFTLADLARCVEQQTGWIRMQRDWYPYSFVEPFCRLVEAVTDEPGVHMSCHAHCGMATYVVVNPQTGQVVPFPAMLDVESMMKEIDRAAERLEGSRWFGNRLALAWALRRLKRFYHPHVAPSGFDFASLAEFMESFVDFGARYRDNEVRYRELEEKPWRVLLLAAMHFQDVYNYEVDRSRRCVVHYAAPDGRNYPFCTYNSGPCFRTRVETQFARSTCRGADAAVQHSG